MPDDGTENAGENEDGQNQNDDGSAGEGKTFSQAELDRIVKDRVARERKKYDGADDWKKKAEEYDKLQEANASEIEKAQKAREKAEADAAKVIATANERLMRAAVLAAAAEAKASKPEHIFRLIDKDGLTIGDDGEVSGASEAVAAFLEANPEYVGKTTPPGVDQGARGGGDKQLSRGALEGMSPAEVREAVEAGRFDAVLKGA